MPRTHKEMVLFMAMMITMMFIIWTATLLYKAIYFKELQPGWPKSTVYQTNLCDGDRCFRVEVF